MFAAIGGLALTGRFLAAADPTLGLQYTLIAIAAVSLGGTPLGGGRGGTVGAILGAACIYLIQNLLSGLGVSALWLQVVYGCALIAAVIVGTQVARAGVAGGTGVPSSLCGTSRPCSRARSRVCCATRRSCTKLVALLALFVYGVATLDGFGSLPSISRCCCSPRSSGSPRSVRPCSCC